MRAENRAFDVTPAELVTAIVTEEGIATAPYEESLRRLVGRASNNAGGAGAPAGSDASVAERTGGRGPQDPGARRR
jgi:hypothetical protein